MVRSASYRTSPNPDNVHSKVCGDGSVQDWNEVRNGTSLVPDHRNTGNNNKSDAETLIVISDWIRYIM